MDLVLNNLQWLIRYKTKPNQIGIGKICFLKKKWLSLSLSECFRSLPYPIHWRQVWCQWIHLSAWPCSTQHSEIYERIVQGEENFCSWLISKETWCKTERKYHPLNLEELKRVMTGKGIGIIRDLLWFYSYQNERNCKYKRYNNKSSMCTNRVLPPAMSK